jgi:3-oxoacyl-[acyl-carrier-protein] synthase III
MPRIAKIFYTGSYVAERVVTNAEIDDLLGVSSNQWLIDNVGIREHCWSFLMQAIHRTWFGS